MKKKNYILFAILVVVIGGILFLIFNGKNDTESDSVRFAKEYTEVSSDNVFVYRDANEIIKILENGTGVVYLGFPECPWCQAYVKYLDEVAREVGIEKIYYYNVFEDRANNTEEYQKMVSTLEDHLQYDDEGKARIYVPNVSFHVNGEVIGNDYETSKDTHDLKDPNEYWNEEEITDLKNTLTEYMEEVHKASNMCTDCNK